MLNVLRNKAQSTLIQGVVLVIAVVFIFWGVGTNLNNNRNAAATVNDQEISFQDYQRAYDTAVENFRQQFGGQIPPGLLEGMGIKQQVLNQLIQTELLRQGGEEMGVMISDFAAQRQIEQMEVFQQNDRFDLERYKAVLSQNRMTPTAFEGDIRADLQSRRVTEDVGSFAIVPDKAILNRFAYDGEEIKLAYVTLDSAAFEDKVDVGEDELAAWFEEHGQEYRSEPKVRLKYLFFDFAEDAEQVEVNDAKLKARYESEKDSYQQPEQRHARHILLKVAEGDAQLVREEQKKKAGEVLNLARGGSDFAALAEQYSEGPTRDRGGDLGFFPRGRMVPAFDEAVFTMQPGEISELVETPFGYHIIKLEEIRPASIRSFEQVKDNLAADMKKQEGRGLTFKRASTAYEEIMRAGSLDRYAQQGKKEVMVSDFFTRADPPQGVTSDPGFLEAAFRLNRGELSSLVEMASGYGIVFVDALQEPGLPDLSAVREQAAADFVRQQAVDLASKTAEELLTKSREKGGLQSAAGNDHQLQSSDFVKRTPSAGADQLPTQVIREGFTLPWKDSMPAKPVQVGNTFYVYEITERRPGSEQVDDARRAEVREQLLTSTRNELINSWLAGVREQAKIWTNEVLFQ